MPPPWMGFEINFRSCPSLGPVVRLDQTHTLGVHRLHSGSLLMFPFYYFEYILLSLVEVIGMGFEHSCCLFSEDNTALGLIQLL